MPKPPKYLYAQVLAAIALGIVVGHFWPETGEDMRPISEGFIRLVKMIIAPIIFCTIVVGIAQSGDMKRVGRVGVKAIVYFEIITTLALAIGLVVAEVVQPGAGLHVNPATLDAKAISGYAAKAHSASAGEMLLGMIPESAVQSFSEGNILQVLIFSLLFGWALAGLGERGAGVRRGIEAVSKVLFGIIGIIMRLAPLGAFGAMAFTVGKYGLDSLSNLGALMAAFYITALLFVLVILGAVCRLVGLRLFGILRYIKDELVLVLGTSSSEAALPGLMLKLEKAGCSKPVVGLVVPMGYSFNLDGTSIYLTMAALFIAQATDTVLPWSEKLAILGVLLLTSKGAAAVTGGGFIALAATLQTTHSLPVAGLALLLGADRFMSEARAVVNLCGNTVASFVVAKWEGELDMGAARAAIGMRSATPASPAPAAELTGPTSTP